MDIKDIKANTIEEFFGTLQQSVVESWRKHLKTDKYSEHIALNEFYEEMPDLVDDLIEAWMGINGKVKEYKNNFTEEKMGTIEYLETLKEFVEKGKDDFMEEDELESLCDDILAQIDSTLYKIKELKENKFMDLKDFLTETSQQINESKNRVFMMLEKGTENWLLVGATDINNAKMICKEFEGDDTKWMGIEVPNVKLANPTNGGVITSQSAVVQDWK